MRHPMRMGDLMLALDRWPALRKRALPALAGKPHLFRNLLAMHVGEISFLRMLGSLAALAYSSGLPCDRSR
jgi:hypothetical protein